MAGKKRGKKKKTSTAMVLWKKAALAKRKKHSRALSRTGRISKKQSGKKRVSLQKQYEALSRRLASSRASQQKRQTSILLARVAKGSKRKGGKKGSYEVQTFNAGVGGFTSGGKTYASKKAAMSAFKRAGGIAKARLVPHRPTTSHWSGGPKMFKGLGGFYGSQSPVAPVHHSPPGAGAWVSAGQSSWGRDWSGQPIRHKRASVLGWQRRFKKQKRKFRGHRPQHPSFHGHRPVKSSARDWSRVEMVGFQNSHRLPGFHGFKAKKHLTVGSGFGRDRDWPKQPIRHARASVLGWRRKLHGRKPSHPTFGGHRPPLFSPVRRDRDWPGQPIRHARASVYGWKKRLHGRKPKHPSFGGHRPPLFTPARDRDWGGQPIRHARASVYGWQKRFAKDRFKKRHRFPGHRPRVASFGGHRRPHPFFTPAHAR